MKEKRNRESRVTWQDAQTQIADMAKGLPGSGMANIKFQTICIGVTSVTEVSTPPVGKQMCSETDFCLVESKEWELRA